LGFNRKDDGRYVAEFWGEPTKFQIVSIENYVEVDIPFDLKSVPKL
jgi:hypothetical protein